MAVRRRALGITQKALAVRADSTARSISAIERGDVRGRSLRRRIEAALALGPARDGESPNARKKYGPRHDRVLHRRAGDHPRYGPARRKCLGGCGRMFDSSWIGERICSRCKGADAGLGA